MNKTRLSRVIANMEAQSLEQIVVTSTSSVYYLTGIHVEPMERMLALYIHTSGRCVLYANELFAIPPQEDLELLLHTDSDDPAALLAAGVAPGRLGIDKSWPSKFLIRVLEARPDVAPVLGSAPVDEARMIKDEAEIAAMRRASRNNDQVVGQAIASHSAVADFTDGVLTIRAESTVWATQLTYLIPQLTDTIRRNLKGLTITEIRVTGPAAGYTRKWARRR